MLPVNSSTTPSKQPPGVLASILRHQRRRLLHIMPLAMVSEAGHMAVPILLGLLVERGVLRGSVLVTVLGGAGILLVRWVATETWAHAFLSANRARLEERHRLGVAITAAVLDPRSRALERPAGEIQSIASADTEGAADLVDLMSSVLAATVTVIGVGVWMTWVDPIMAPLLLVGLGLIVLAVRAVAPTLAARYDDQRARAAEAASTAADLVKGLRVLQGLGVQTRARATYRARSRTALTAALVNARFSGVSTGMITVITTVFMAAVALVVAQRALVGAIGVGTLIAVVGATRNLSGLLQAVAGVPVWWASICASARRVRTLLDDLGRTARDPALSISGPDAPRERRGAAGGLRIEPLGVVVPDGAVVAIAAPDLHDADLVVAALAGTGQQRAFVGEQEITPASLPGLRADLLVEPHAVDLFDGTLREQLATALPRDAADGWEDRALTAAGAQDLLRILPEGLETRILDRGANLSGGQRQRIALARAVAADAPVLVLHDPTTAVDAVTEQRIAEALLAVRRRPDRATAIITRAPALLRAADHVVLLRDGAVAARGAHHALLSEDDYRKMVER